MTAAPVLIGLATVVLVGLPVSAQNSLPSDTWSDTWSDKVEPWVQEQLATEGESEFLVFLEEQADLTSAADLRSKHEKTRFVVERLRAVAERSQGPVVAEMHRRGLEHRAYWVANMIWVRGGEADVVALASRADVRSINANPSVSLPPNDRVDDHRVPFGGPEPGLFHVGAPDFWSSGSTGQDVVVAGADTGYSWQHPALTNQYRGRIGAAVSHDYNWHDAVHSGGGVCGSDSTEPCDDHGHGTHTMGTMVGDDGGVNQIGVAPGARWIGCRNMDRGNGTPTTYSECFQFFLAPTDLSGQNPDPLLAPDVVNGSWGCPASEGCTDPAVLETVVENVRAAGIVVVQAAGNSGSSCGSINTPAAIYDASFTVGAVDLSDEIAGFSSRGPVTVDGSNRLKPDVSAPGVSVRSASPGGGYSNSSGTSMAAPHVSGLVALLISAVPGLRGDVDALEQHLRDTAVAGQAIGQSCGGIPDTVSPNNVYGFGSVRAVVPAELFRDDFESGDGSEWSVVLP